MQVFNEIQTLNPKNRKATHLRLRPHSHRDRPKKKRQYRTSNYSCFKVETRGKYSIHLTHDITYTVLVKTKKEEITWNARRKQDIRYTGNHNKSC